LAVAHDVQRLPAMLDLLMRLLAPDLAILRLLDVPGPLDAVRARGLALGMAIVLDALGACLLAIGLVALGNAFGAGRTLRAHLVPFGVRRPLGALHARCPLDMGRLRALRATLSRLGSLTAVLALGFRAVVTALVAARSRGGGR
jgi:hypothetical protein